MPASVRPLDPHDDHLVALVAHRMGLTLDEVIGDDRSHHRYTQAWLEARVRAHLDPAQLEGGVLLAFLDDDPTPVGHTIVRRETDGPPDRGVFSTTWVSPHYRRLGVARVLLDHGEAWMVRRGMDWARTDTATHNSPLRVLFERRGYRVVERAPDGSMVRLARRLEPQDPRG